MASSIDTQDIDVNQLASLEVLDETGAATTLSDLWRERPAVLVFVRHFG